MRRVAELHHEAIRSSGAHFQFARLDTIATVGGSRDRGRLATDLVDSASDAADQIIDDAGLLVSCDGDRVLLDRQARQRAIPRPARHLAETRAEFRFDRADRVIHRLR
ncbi:MAG: hypothetical protein ACFHWZ_12230 [Phycisphaerales bacterium]